MHLEVDDVAPARNPVVQQLRIICLHELINATLMPAHAPPARQAGSIRIIDQVKAYAPHHRVRADDVRALVGVLEMERNVSKGVLTTTSTFAPGVAEDGRIAALTPYRLELKDGPKLIEWLGAIADKNSPGREGYGLCCRTSRELARSEKNCLVSGSIQTDLTRKTGAKVHQRRGRFSELLASTTTHRCRFIVRSQ
jgi:hypothetical protein